MEKTSVYIAIGVVVFLVIGAIYLQFSPSDMAMTKNIRVENSDLKNYGPAPEFVGIDHWLNSEALTIKQLRGRVVLIDFWTYSCINCIRTLPYVTGWYEKYKDKGFVVVGVHTPEFAFEKDTANVQTALKRHEINYPVAQDNDYATWNAYSNRYWPAHYLIDQQGNVVYVHFGEGKYEETERTIQQLLGVGEMDEMPEDRITRDVKTPEIYFGLKRLDKGQSYFELEGQWSYADESVRLLGNTGKIKLNFYAKDVHIVAESRQEAEVKVFVDGQLIKILKIKDSSLYTLFEGEDSKQRTLELQVEGSGFEVYTFTFG